MRITQYRRNQLWPKICHVHSVEDVENVQFKVEEKNPPNFETIRLVFPATETLRVLYTYDHVIYNPSRIPELDLSILAHECTHILQQDEIGAAQWWDFYIAQPKFRFEQELDAYSVEYRSYCRAGHNRADRKRHCRSCAERLTGPLYNRMARRRDAEELIKLIKHEEDQHVREGTSNGRVAASAGAELAARSGVTDTVGAEA